MPVLKLDDLKFLRRSFVAGSKSSKDSERVDHILECLDELIEEADVALAEEAGEQEL